MTTEEASYSINQVQELIQSGIQIEIVDWFQSIDNKKFDPNIAPPPPTLHLQSDNVLIDADLTKLATLLKQKTVPSKPPHTPFTTKVYTGIAQGVDAKSKPITYYWSHGRTCNLDHNSTN